MKWIKFISALRIVKCKMWTWVQSVMMLLRATQMSHGDPLKPVSSFMFTFSPHFHPYPVKQGRTGRAKTCCLKSVSALPHGHTLSERVTRLTTDPWLGCGGDVGSFIVPVIKVSTVSWELTSPWRAAAAGCYAHADRPWHGNMKPERDAFSRLSSGRCLE